MSHYRDVVIETFKNKGGASRSSVRARPVEGQDLDVSMNVECSSKMRKGYPVGTKFLLQAKVTDRDGGTPFLYAHYNAPYRVVSDEEAAEFINKFKV
ncbi:hypothetical protein [uncultured Marinobacter sp.]|uniref:hypothetical protein n=1 Tax=uncultured Marinobacter sp. TaxID=187379 RepID=UPI0025F81316|nr:hypothetical protein [uncultured Marinobacter sp.]